MPTRNVVLTNHQAALVDRLVQSGHFQNASEVLREGLRLLEQREAEDAARLVALKDAARLGIAAMEGGDFRSFDDAIDLMTHLDAVAEKAIGDDR